jgi:hypothetical protein
LGSAWEATKKQTPADAAGVAEIPLGCPLSRSGKAKPVKEETTRAIAYAAAARINKKARSSIYSYESFSYGI